MKKRDVLKLRPGSIIMFGNSVLSQEIKNPRLGVVKLVARSGYITVAVHNYRHPHTSLNDEELVPFGHVLGERKPGTGDFNEVVMALNNGASV